MEKLDRITVYLLVAVAFCCLFSITRDLHTLASPPSHNEQGGYIDACGELPGQLGDDC